MRNLIMAAMIILLLPGCTKVLYTHQQVMDGYKTKDQVTKAFGIPTQKKMAADTEEWLYRYEMKTTGKRIASQAQNVKTADVTDFTKFNRYIIFAFDKQGNITGQQSVGVDLTQKVKAPEGTIGLIVGGIALTALVIVAANAMVQSAWTY